MKAIATLLLLPVLMCHTLTAGAGPVDGGKLDRITGRRGR